MLRRLDSSLENMIRHAIAEALDRDWEAVPASLVVSGIDDGPGRGRVAIVIKVRRRETKISRGWLDRNR